MGRLILVQGPSLDSEPPHNFDQVSGSPGPTSGSPTGPSGCSRRSRAIAGATAATAGFPNRTLGDESGGVSPNTVRIAIRELERLGYLRTEPDKAKARGQRLVLLYTLKRPGPPV